MWGRAGRHLFDMLINPMNPDLADEATTWTDAQTAAWGYLPNYAAAFASRPDVARAWTTLNLAVRNGMDRRRFEIATISAARAMRSTYCTAAHSKFLRDTCGDEEAMVALAADPDTAELDPADRAVAAFARRVVLDAAGITADDIASLRAVGLGDNDIADIVFAVGARCFFATALDAMGVQADAQLRAAFAPALADQMVVGRPMAAPPAGERSTGTSASTAAPRRP
ncbi:MAG: putative peroxidase-related enzyme [Ilumatobacteraceae bacterium]|nr:putative peroxidase-related enzyme [Ilumatobacteraceae bacterium]